MGTGRIKAGRGALLLLLAIGLIAGLSRYFYISQQPTVKTGRLACLKRSSAKLSQFSSKMAVSLACGPGDSLVLANYAELTLLSEQGEQVLTPSGCPGIWNPTSVDRINEALWAVANYNGGNVLLGSIEQGRFRCVREIVVDGMKWPEGVSAIPGGDDFLIADYGSGEVYRFDILGRLKWRTAVSRLHSHGVLATSDFAYATDLADRRLVKLELSSGKVLAATGSIGRGVGEFLWPVSIDTFNSLIMLTDAHQNRISFFNSELEPMGYLTSEGFNFPYGAYQSDQGIVVLNSLSMGILEWSVDKGTFKSFGSGDAGSVLKTRRISKKRLPKETNWHCSSPYTANYGIKVGPVEAAVFGIQARNGSAMLRPSYNAVSVTEECQALENIPMDIDGQILFGDAQAYNMWMLDGRVVGENKIVFGSKQILNKYGEISLETGDKCPLRILTFVNLPKEQVGLYAKAMAVSDEELNGETVRKSLFRALEKLRPLATIACVSLDGSSKSIRRVHSVRDTLDSKSTK